MFQAKSTVAEIRSRFDQSVESFINVETGQSTTVDAPIALELISRTIASVSPNAQSLLDVGCGAGNYAVKIRQAFPALDITLVDLSRPMLDRALERLSQEHRGKLTALQGDIRELSLGSEQFDVIVAAMVLHHLRGEEEWRAVFQKFAAALKPGGSLWVSDFIDHSIPEVQKLMWERYGDYLTSLKDTAYRDSVFDYVQREDSPRPLLFQIDLLREVGFRDIDVLHKNSCFAVFGGVKAVPSPCRII